MNFKCYSSEELITLFFLKLPFAVSFSDLFINIQYAVFRKSLRASSVSLYMYIYIYMHIHIYMHIRVYICIWIGVYMHLYLCMLCIVHGDMHVERILCLYEEKINARVFIC